MKHLKTLIFLLTILSLSTAFAQTNVLDWAIQAGNGGSEYGESVATDAAGNIYATGWFTGTVDFDPGVGVHELSGVSSNQTAYVLKLNSNGGFEWAYAYNLNITSRGYDIAVDDNGLIYIVGSNGVGSFLLTMDSDGNIDDSSNFPNSNFFEVEIDGNGNIYTTGIFYNTADFDPSEASFNVTAEGDNDIFVLKLNSDFEFVWVKTVGSTGDDRGEDLAVDANGNVYTTGYFETTADFDPGIGTSSLTPAGSADAFILKLDANGDFVWVKQLGGPNFENGNSIANFENNLYITGRFQNTVDFDPNAGIHELTASGDDAFVLSLNRDGEFQWVGQLGGSSSQRGISITTDKTGNIYVGGLFAGTTDFDFGAGTFELTAEGAFDMYVQKLDPNGNLLFAKSAGGSSEDYLHHIFVDDNFNVITTGRFQSTADFDPGVGVFNLTSAGSYDAYIQKLESVVHIPDANFKAELLADININTVDDGEITFAEAEAFDGLMNYQAKGITDLTGLEAFINVKQLRLSGNDVGSLDLSNHPDLTEVSCGNCGLTEIDLSAKPDLFKVSLVNNAINEIDLSGLPALLTLNMVNTNISTIDFTNNPILLLFWAGGTNLTEIDVSMLTNFKDMWIDGAPNLQSVNLANGINTNFLRLKLLNNPNLTCVTVDDPIYSEGNWKVMSASFDVDVSIGFSTDCSNTETDLLTFSIPEQVSAATIDAIVHTINVEVPDGTDLSSLTPTFTISAGATVNPESGVAQDFSTAFVYTVTSQNPSVSQQWTVNVAFPKEEQAITFNAIENQFLESGAFALSATASSGLPVAFEILDGPASIAGNTLTMTATGQVTVKATQPGDATYAAAPPVEQSFEIILITGVPEQRGPQFKFYPNPVDRTLVVVPNGSDNQLSLQDVQGRTVTTRESKSNDAIELDVSYLPMGMYVLKLSNEAGVSQTKILKK